MDLNYQLDNLASNITERSFRDNAKRFEQDLKLASHLSAEEREAVWQRYQQIWEERKQYIKQRKEDGRHLNTQLSLALDSLSHIIDSREFPDQAKEFQADLKSAKALSREQRDQLWNRYQGLWSKRKKRFDKKKQSSENAKRQYMDMLNGLDYRHDGPPILQSFSSYERVGDKIHIVREQLKSMQQKIKVDDRLLPKNRHEIFDAINSIWQKTKEVQETTQSVHSSRAGELYNEAHYAVHNLPPRESSPILKAASAEVRTLYLDRSDRSRYRSMFDELWARLKSRFEEGRQKYEDWRRRQQEALERLRAARSRAIDALERVRNNISENQSRLYDAKSDDFASTVSGWIQEGEEKARDIENSIDEISRKIDDIERQLRS